ncbi:hypothetical protein THRCLA_00178, partial [Thraustotheca clavata]
MERDEFAGGDGLWDVDLASLLSSTAPMLPDPIPWMHGRSRESVESNASMSNQDISYERKKSRAKITRVEVNAGFDDLLTVLRLPNSRKNSRAKIIQYACERIRALESENDRLKQQLNAVPVHAAAVATPSAPSALHNNGTMLWIPCSITPLVSQNAPPVPTPRLVQLPAKVPKKPRKTNKVSTLIQSTMAASCLATIVHTCPEILRFLDGVMLSRLAQTSKEWNRLILNGKNAYLWENLMIQRWCIPKDELFLLTRSLTDVYHKWKYLDQSMLLPQGAYTKDESIVAMGR